MSGDHTFRARRESFGRRGRPAREAPSRPVESLESRRLLSAAVDAGVWRILGDSAGRRGPAADDVIVVELVPGNPAALRATVNGADAGTRDVAALSGVEVFAGRGNDTVRVRVGSDAVAVRVDGGAGDDLLVGSSGPETLVGGAGDDTLDGGGGDDQLFGDAGDDQLLGGDGADTLRAGGGDDVLAGGWGGDALLGEKGRDRLDGGGDPDDCDGGPGADTLAGGDGADSLRGGKGRDRVFREAATDLLPTVARADRNDTLLDDTRAAAAPIRSHDDADLKQWLIDAAVAQWKWAFDQPVWGWNWAYARGGEVRVVNVSAPTDAPPDPSAGPVPSRPPDASGNFAGRPVATPTPTPSPAPGVPDDAAGDDDTDTSDTNVQEQGVDEADLVETDGRYIYALRGSELVIVDALPASGMRVVSRTPLDGEGIGIYRHGGRLTVLTGSYPYDVIPLPGGGGVAVGDAARFVPPVPAKPTVVVRVLDVTNPAAPAEVEKTTLDGSYGASRMVGERLYVVLGNNTWVPAPRQIPADPLPTPTPTPTPEPVPPLDDVEPGAGDAVGRPVAPPDVVDATEVYESEASYRAWLGGMALEELLPSFTSTAAGGGDTSGLLVSSDDAYLRSTTSPDLGQNLTTLALLDVGDAAGGPSATSTVAGWGGTVYASAGALYLTSVQWGGAVVSDLVVDGGDVTRVFKFALGAADAVPLVATGEVPGSVLNPFAMDEAQDGAFRIATNAWAAQGGPTTGLYVLEQSGDELGVIGSVTNLARGESLRAARFVGDDRAYLVTFRQVDPLFTIDLSDARHPRVAGELVIPGFSSYLQPVGDWLLLGLGRDIDPQTNRDRGLQLSLFDVSDPADPKRLAVQLLATPWSSSEAEADHHAFAYFPESGLLALPVRAFDDGFDAERQTLMVVKVDPALGAGALQKLAETEPPGGVRRSLRIGQVLYAVGPTHVQASDLSQPGNVIGTLGID